MNIKVYGTIMTDPVLRVTAAKAREVISFRLYLFTGKTPDGEFRRSEVVNVSAWSGAAKMIDGKFKKFDHVTVTGWVQETNTFVTKNGEERESFNISATNVERGNTIDIGY